MTDASQLIGKFVGDALTVQRRLEGELTVEYLMSLRPSDGMIYSFRTLALNAEFLLQKQINSTFLIFFHRDGDASRLVHSLSLELRASPTPPILPAEPDGGLPRIQLGLPSFMLTADDDLAIRKAVSDAMLNLRWSSAVPGVTVEQVRNAGADVMQSPSKGRGPIAFRLATDNTLFLVVVVTPKNKPDGLYLYSVDFSTVTIFSIPSVDQDTIEYMPLQFFAAAVHDSLFGTRGQSADVFQGSVGVIADLDSFVGQLADAYRAARLQLAQAAATPSPIPSYFDLSPLTAKISYAASFDPNQDTGTSDITQQTGVVTGGGTVEDQMQAILGSADITISTDGPGQKAQVVVAAPNFVLSGDSLTVFLNMARAIADDISKQFDGDSFPREDYLDAIAGRSDVVALQSFSSNKASGDFLVMWPGTGNAVGRDFVFTCHIDLKHQQLQHPKKVMALGQDVAGARITDRGDDDFDHNQYGPFHNMFHAILLWMTSLRAQ